MRDYRNYKSKKICKQCLIEKDLSEYDRHPNCFYSPKNTKAYPKRCRNCLKIGVRSSKFYKGRTGTNDYRKIYYRNKYHTDLNYKLSQKLRARFKNAFKRNSKKSSVLDHIGCTIDELKVYLESKFRPGMTWDNYGPIWEIDHIIPLSRFDHTSLENLNEAWNFNNLQPLFKSENRKKSDN